MCLWIKEGKFIRMKYKKEKKEEKNRREERNEISLIDEKYLVS
jgi:hypothetical protein